MRYLPDSLYDQPYETIECDLSAYRLFTADAGAMRRDAQGVTIPGTHSGSVRLEALRDGVIRIRIDPHASTPAATPTEQLDLVRLEPAAGEANISEQAGVVQLATDALTASFDAGTGALKVTDAQGRTLLQTRNGARFGEATDASGEHASVIAFDRRDDEAFFGFGGRIMPPNRTGTSVDVFSVKVGTTSGDYGGFPLPWCISTAGYGVFLNNPWPHVYFDMGRTDPSQWFIHTPGGPLDLLIVPGPEFDALLRRFTAMVGRIATPPRWLMGFWCSALNFESADAAIADATRMHDEQYPCDIFVFDGPWRSGKAFTDIYARSLGYTSHDFNWHADFGDGPAMLARLSEMGVKTGLHLNSRSFSPATTEAGIAKNLLRRQGGEVVPRVGDATAEQWYSELLAPRVKEGVALWWTDHADRVSGEVLPGLPSRNLFGPLWNRTLARLMREQGGAACMSLSRGGGIGSQPYALPWPGDTRCGLDALLEDLWFIVNAGLGGFPLSSADLGGFTNRKHPHNDYSGPDERNAEMFDDENIARRVCHLLPLIPLPRIHNNWSTLPKFPWRCSEPVQKLYRDALQWRYRLTPYLHHYALRAADTGEPLLRPLAYHHREDRACWDVNDVFYLGDSLLVAPVYEPGATRRQLRLPAGRWVHFWTGRIYDGAGEIEVDAPLYSVEGLPLFIKAGGILPRQPLTMSLDDAPPETLELEVYHNGEPASLELYEAQNTRTKIEVAPAPAGVTLTVASTSPQPRRIEVRLHQLPPQPADDANWQVADSPARSATLKPGETLRMNLTA